MKASLIALVGAAAVCACASPGGGQRTSLTTDDLAQIKPEMTAHRLCVASKVRDFIGSTNDVQLMVNTAVHNCRGRLAEVSTALDRFALDPAAKRRYLAAIETTVRNNMTEVVLKAHATAARNQAEQRAEERAEQRATTPARPASPASVPDRTL